jgi:bis(5'-nucleosyl)-tetraphosphatase (symmetrical)
MALYMIGDIQGCDQALSQLLTHIGFSPSRDTLYALGDLVNRGPDSLGVLRRLRELGSSAQCLLGNHDLHLLAVGIALAPTKRRDTLQSILDAPERDSLLHWLRQQPLAIHAHGWLMVHAGVLPQWTLAQAMTLAKQASATLGHADLAVCQHFLQHMYGNTPDHWAQASTASPLDQLRLIVNGFTRIRLCDGHGRMDFVHKESAQHAPAGLVPWFEAPNRATLDTRIAFGHWSTLAPSTATRVCPGSVLPLDAGCVWGGCLQAAEFSAYSDDVLVHRVSCEQAQRP